MRSPHPNFCLCAFLRLPDALGDSYITMVELQGVLEGFWRFSGQGFIVRV